MHFNILNFPPMHFINARTGHQNITIFLPTILISMLQQHSRDDCWVVFINNRQRQVLQQVEQCVKFRKLLHSSVMLPYQEKTTLAVSRDIR